MRHACLPTCAEGCVLDGHDPDHITVSGSVEGECAGSLGGWGLGCHMQP